MESQIRDLRSDVRGINDKLDGFIKCYVTKDELIETEDRLKNKLEEKANFNKWIPTLVSSICAIIMVILAVRSVFGK